VRRVWQHRAQRALPQKGGSRNPRRSTSLAFNALCVPAVLDRATMREAFSYPAAIHVRIFSLSCRICLRQLPSRGTRAISAFAPWTCGRRPTKVWLFRHSTPGTLHEPNIPVFSSRR
jgi:hypothetical protein